MLKRSAGVLMSVSSLPSRYGIGGFGEETLRWIDTISAMLFSYWQLLPIGPLDNGCSPYASDSAFAGNYFYIDPDDLYNLGLITKDELNSCIYHGNTYTVDYNFVKNSKLDILKKAYSRRTVEINKKVEKFKHENDWILDYSLYLSLKEKNGQKPWWDWKDSANYNYALESKEEDLDFWCFTQYIFFYQWNKIKEYANEKGIKIIGDMPIYIAMDSCDVWSHPELFQLDKDTLKPKNIAGVPPDYFSADGQLWGNPLYNWNVMKEQNFSWWIKRIKFSLSVYDVVRIDHFRALASYFAVPAGADTAKIGRWEKGPGQLFFDVLKKELPDAEIIAEDLGVFDEDVVNLLLSSGCPGMRIIQFGFESDSDNSHLPHNYPINSVAYTGTHDNQTLLGWLWSASKSEREFALEYCGFEGNDWGTGGFFAPACRKIIETVWRSPSKTAIIPFQDMCGFGDDARMNIPGVPKQNWRFRTTEETISEIDVAYFKKINKIFKRN